MLYQPAQQVSVDERMVKCKARISFKQYIKNKQVKSGFKLFAACESQSGHLFNFKVYTGRSEPSGDIGLTRTVVEEILARYENQGYEVYFDQFHNSPDLANPFLNVEFTPLAHVKRIAVASRGSSGTRSSLIDMLSREIYGMFVMALCFSFNGKTRGWST